LSMRWLPASGHCLLEQDSLGKTIYHLEQVYYPANTKEVKIRATLGAGNSGNSDSQ
jgi:hypothetical protein